MRILLIDNHEDGVYKCRGDLIKRLLQEHEVYLSLPKGKYTEEMISWGCHFEDVEINRRGTNPIDEIRLIAYYRKLLKRLHPDLVLTFSIKPNSYVGFICGNMKIPYVANITGLGSAILGGGILSKISLCLYRVGLRHAKMVFFQNEYNRDFMLERGVVYGPNKIIPGSGVNLQEHTFEPYPPEDLPISFLTIGRLMKDKGTNELLEAAKEIKKRHPKVAFHLIGFYDGDYEEKIKKAQADGTVIFHGHQDDVHSFVTKSHATIHPSYHEGMANALLESAAAGRPVLASDIPGCRETFEDGVTGIAFQPKDSGSLVAAIEEFLALSYEAKTAMGAAARRKMEREFDRNIIIENYLEQIKELE